MKKHYETHSNGYSHAAFMELIAILDKGFRDLLFFIDPAIRPPNKFFDLMKLPVFKVSCFYRLF
jgi:hypothetical protein